jgi:anti-anti-sigma regulatory factor
MPLSHLSPASEVVAITGPLTAETVVALRAELLGTLPADRAVTIDLGGVTEVDTAGLQLLVAARKWSQARNQTFAIVSVSACVASLGEALGIDLPTTGVE